MVRIVSGVSEAPEYDSGAILRGFEKGAAYRQKQQAAQDAQLGRMLQMEEIKMRFQKARAEREELLNKQAQMGSVKAIEEMEMRAKLPESDQLAQDAFKATQSITDPDARKLAIASFDGLIKETKAREENEAFEGIVSRAAEDGLLDPNPNPTDQETKQKNPNALPTVGDFLARRDAGESMSALSKELAEGRAKRSTNQANVDANMRAIEAMDAAIAAMPDGRQKRLATIAANEYKASPSRQKEEGSGQKVLAAIQKTGIGELSQYDAIRDAEDEMVAQKRARALSRQRSDKTPAPGLGGMTAGERFQEMEKTPNFFGRGGPVVPPFSGGTRATSKRGGAARQVNPVAVKQAVDAAPSADHFMEQLRQAGIDPDSDEGALMILESLKSGDAAQPAD